MFITTFSGRFVRKAAATTLLVVSALIIFQFVKPAVSSEAGPRGYHGFIKRYGTKLADEKCQEFYVNGWNSWGLMEAAAGKDYALPVGWAKGGRAFIQEKMTVAMETNFNTLRVFAYGIGEGFPILHADGAYNEEALVAMDTIIQEAASRGIRLIIPMANNWLDEVDSKAKFAEWASGGSVSNPDETFFTSQAARDKYKSHIANMVNRRNTQTGVKWRDDPTILMWNVMNEPRCDAQAHAPCFEIMHQWLEEMANFIKSQDPNHLVSIGSEGFYHMSSGRQQFNPGWDGTVSWAELTGQDFIRNNGISSVDVATVHIWPDDWAVDEGSAPFVRQWILSHVADAESLGKPVIVEEFGKKKEAHEPATIRDLYYDIVYDEAVKNMERGSALKGVLFWEWHSTTSEETDSAFDRPYGVKETDSTWYHVIKPSSQALADVVADRHQRGMTVPGCTPSQS